MRDLPTCNIVDNTQKEVLLYYEQSTKIIKEKMDKNAEVFTPINLVNEMLDKLPEEVWSNPELKWLDPATGIGVFPLIVYYRLMEGLKEVILDEEERRRHILENQLYMVELNDENCIILNMIFCNNIN
jgi:hypothetical protein